MPRVTPEHADARRQQILDAAHACFLRNGFHQTSMQDIQREAGLSAGAIYLYFKGKDDIILGIALRILAGVGNLIPDQPEIDGAQLTLAAIVSHFLRGADAVQQEHDVFPVVLQIWAEAIRNPPMRDQLLASVQVLRERLEHLIVACQRAGIVRSDANPAALALAIIGLGQGFIVQRTLLGPDLLDTYLAGMRALLENASGGPGGRGDGLAQPAGNAT
jgi:AcrR family transcriptional regulator